MQKIHNGRTGLLLGISPRDGLIQDLDDLLKHGIYSVTKQATNAPVTDSKDLAVGSIVEVKNVVILNRISRHIRLFQQRMPIKPDISANPRQR